MNANLEKALFFLVEIGQIDVMVFDYQVVVAHFASIPQVVGHVHFFELAHILDQVLARYFIRIFAADSLQLGL